MPEGIGYGNAAKMSAKSKKRKSTDEYIDEQLKRAEAKKKKAETKKKKAKTKRTSDVEKKLRDAGLTEEEIKRLRGK
jgi:hypothetical protein